MRKFAFLPSGAFFILLSLSLFLTACGGGGTADTGNGSDTETTEPPQSMVAEEPEQEEGKDPIRVSEDGEAVFINMTGNDQMQYNINRIEVEEGQTIKLTLNHIGNMSVEVMGHNFVLLEQGVKVEEFANKAVQYKANDYIPTEEENVIVYTEMIGGGQSTSIEFEAPPKGTYKFLCSFPAHYVNMQGDFIVN